MSIYGADSRRGVVPVDGGLNEPCVAVKANPDSGFYFIWFEHFALIVSPYQPNPGAPRVAPTAITTLFNQAQLFPRRGEEIKCIFLTENSRFRHRTLASFGHPSHCR